MRPLSDIDTPKRFLKVPKNEVNAKRKNKKREIPWQMMYRWLPSLRSGLWAFHQFVIVCMYAPLAGATVSIHFFSLF